MIRLPFFLLLLVSGLTLQAQGFLHADGKNIVNGQGEEVILRGIGTGNWMLQEGYMMKSAGVAGTQHEFRAKLVETIGEARTDSFYMAWLANHISRTDVDSMKAWGFNSVRPALHYKWFTLPIEEEPVAGEHTWLDTGFELVDSLLDWCSENEMYVILDLHGAPGGQGKNADISDYDPSKPSLWESDANKDKTVALWQKLAERYAEEAWIGGYDLINETNWTFPEGNNSQMRSLYMRITDSIRTVDTSHIIFIEGNSFANDFSGLTPPWDDNMAYSFHKYWSYNRSNSLDWVLGLRQQHNVPLWLGESGENSNTWFTNAIALSESKNIGWSWWPVKKGGINNVLEVVVNEDYLKLIDNWKGIGPMLTADEAYAAVMTWAENHRIENCIYHPGVVDAMIRQPHSTETRPFRERRPGDVIFASEYDFGRNGHAYLDMDTANYTGEGQDFTAWNAGWAFRNDGVDLEAREDETSNGSIVGWTEAGEWMAYTLESDSAAVYALEIRSASGNGGGKVHLEVNGTDATGTIALPFTGGWGTWRSTEVEGVLIPEGRVELKLYIEESGANLNWFRFHNPMSADSLDFEVVSARVEGLGGEVEISLNMDISKREGTGPSDFRLSQNGVDLPIDQVIFPEGDERKILLQTSVNMFYKQEFLLAYQGSAIQSGEKTLRTFEGMEVVNELRSHSTLPALIQAEAYYQNEGLELEDCSDTGGGKNLAYAHPGDYTNYLVYLEEAGRYALDFRVSTPNSGASIYVKVERDGGTEYLGNIKLSSTGGWQNWKTQSTQLELPAGKYLLRLSVAGEEYNLNWFQVKSTVSVEQTSPKEEVRMWPNPASGLVHLEWTHLGEVELRVVDSRGRVVESGSFTGGSARLDTKTWSPGIYLIRLRREDVQSTTRLLVR